jgi:hypothetical protein
MGKNRLNVVIALALAGSNLALAQSIPVWRLEAPMREIGRDGKVELHRVRGAAPMSGGRIAIADGGSSRVVIVDSTGKLERYVGRHGTGPGEHEVLLKVHAFGDTLVTVGGPGSRAITWTPTGTAIRTSGVSDASGRVGQIEAVASPRLVIGAFLSTLPAPTGLHQISAAFGSYDAITRTAVEFRRETWSYTYQYRQPEGGTTGYGTPFLGQGLLAGVAGRIVHIPLGGNIVEVLNAEGVVLGRVTLPVTRPEFDRRTIDLYRESLLMQVRKGATKDSDPATVQRNIDRINAVFGEQFPVPQRISAVEEIVVAGGVAWLRAFAVSADTLATWFVVDPGAMRVVATARMPNSWRVLGGTRNELFVLRRDADEVEYVAVQRIRRS